MLPQLISDKDVILWNEIVGKTRKAIITAHASPDGDAIGSSLGLAGYLRRRGIEVHW